MINNAIVSDNKLLQKSIIIKQKRKIKNLLEEISLNFIEKQSINKNKIHRSIIKEKKSQSFHIKKQKNQQISKLNQSIRNEKNASDQIFTKPINFEILKPLEKKNIEKKNLKPIILTLENLRILKLEMENDEEIRNTETIDNIIGNLYYFKKFSKFYRKKIFKSAKFISKETNEIIFKEGEQSDYVYIILRGAVSISVKQKKYIQF